MSEDAVDRAKYHYAGYSCRQCGYYHHPDDGCGRYDLRKGLERAPFGPSEVSDPPDFSED